MSISKAARATRTIGLVAALALGTSVFALSGLLLGDPGLSIPQLLEVIGVALVWDLLLTPLVLPAVMTLFRRLEPDRSLA